MKKLFTILIMLFTISAYSQIGTAPGGGTPVVELTYGITSSNSAPNWNPETQGNGKYSRFHINKATTMLYIWSEADDTWYHYGLVARISGSGSPMYTPENTNEIVVNAAGSLYAWATNTSSWVAIAGGGGSLPSITGPSVLGIRTGTGTPGQINIGTGLSIDGSNNLINIGDLSTTNELQTITSIPVSGGVAEFQLSNSGGSVYFSQGAGTTITGYGSSLDPFTITAKIVSSGAYNPLTNNVTLTMSDGSTVVYSHNEVKYNNGSLSGTATHNVGVDYTNGRIYYKDNVGNWANATVLTAQNATNATNAQFAISATTANNVANGDYGDITVASGVWDIDANTVGSTELISSGVTAGTYGDGVTVPQITVDADGRITSVTGVTITGGGGGSSQYITVADRAALISSTAGYSIAYVTNTTYGGWFYKVTNGTVNGGTVLQGNGIDEWLRIFNNEIDPKWWLGDGTNQTADDDIDAFNKAIAFAGSPTDPNKYQISLNPKQVYSFTSVGAVDSVLISSGIRNLIIDGKGASIQMGPNQPVGFAVRNAQRVTFKNINFTGNGEFSATGDYKNTFPSAATEGTFIRFNDDNCGDNRVENCTFTKFNAYAIDILKLSGSTAYFKGVTVKDCFFFEAEIDPTTWKQFCIKLGQWAEYCIIENNKFEKVPRCVWGASNGANTWYNNNMTSNMLAQQQRDNAVATATVSSGVITGITVNWAGNGYKAAPTVYIYDAAGPGTGATATVVMDAYSGVYSVSVTNGGSGYVSPVIAFETNFGAVVGLYYLAHRQFQPVASITVSGGVITSVNQTYKGLGYTSIPTIGIPPGAGGGTGGALTGILNSEGGLTITISSGGSGYTNGTYNISSFTGGGSPRTNAGKGQFVGGKYNHVEHNVLSRAVLGGSPIISIIDNDNAPSRNRQLTVTNLEALVVGDNGGTSTVINVTVTGGVVQPTATIVTTANSGYVSETLYAKVPGTYTTPARFSFTTDGDGKITAVTVVNGGSGYSTSGTQALILSQDPTNENSSNIITSFNCYTTMTNSTFQGKGNAGAVLEFYKVDSLMMSNIDINGGQYSLKLDNCPGARINWPTIVVTEASIRPFEFVNGTTVYYPGSPVTTGTSLTGNGQTTALEVNVQKGTGSGLTGTGTAASPLQLAVVSDPLVLKGNGTAASPLALVDKFNFTMSWATSGVTLTVASTDAFIRVPKAWNGLKVKNVSTGFATAGTGTNTVAYTISEGGFTTTDVWTTSMGTTVNTRLDSVCTQLFDGMLIKGKVTAIGATAPKGLQTTLELTSGTCGITNVANFVPIAQYGTVLSAMGANVPSLNQRLKQNALVTALVNGGVWSKLDALYLFNEDANHQSSANINFIAPGNDDAVPSGTNVQWTTNVGYSLNGVFNDAADMVTLRAFNDVGTQSLQDSMTFGVWINQDYAGGSAARLINETALIYPIHTAGNTSYRINNNAGNSNSRTIFSAGFKALNRNCASAWTIYDNATIYNETVVSTGKATTCRLFRFSQNYTGAIQAAWHGLGLSPTQMTTLRTALNTYFTP